ncbi:MAG: DUF302 domain-containing protein [Bacteroidales bacterium]|jgi:uncharacterized protein (DUF302 family)|nr:DUF302 domain-containing protein [Bacteroidales bacterium]MDY0077443.1 DUF302 domain-containing protein [Bacteroidales bacterium]MDY0078084.1 DUF302 domain-containing protein [Bacteroidales bacterium]
MKYAITKTFNEDYDQLKNRTIEALKTIGFGILSTIEVDKVLKDRIGADFKRYTILGACNPHFAFEALQLEEHLGVLLPCNVVIIDKGNGQTELAAMEPAVMIANIGNEKLTQIAQEISTKLEKLIDSL